MLCNILFFFRYVNDRKSKEFFANKIKNCMFEKNMTYHIRNTQIHFMYICRTFFSKDRNLFSYATIIST